MTKGIRQEQVGKNKETRDNTERAQKIQKEGNTMEDKSDLKRGRSQKTGRKTSQEKGIIARN